MNRNRSIPPLLCEALGGVGREKRALAIYIRQVREGALHRPSGEARWGCEHVDVA